jgi:uncharacterized protein YjeT (DUF2065 family)
VLEGLPSFIAPGAIRRGAARMAEAPEAAIRFVGLVAMLGGLALVWFSRR